MKRAALAVCALAACTYDEKHFAGPYECLGAPPPTSALARVTLRGITVEAATGDVLPAATVTLQDRNLSTIDGPKTSGQDGSFSFSLNTGGAPAENIYFAATATDSVQSLYVTARPITDNLFIPQLPILSNASQAGLAMGLFGVGGQFTSGTGHVFVTIRDCNDRTLPGATVTSVPAGVIRYFDGVMPSMTRTATDPFGLALIANLPPGQVAVNVTVDGMVLPPRMLNVAANAFTSTDFKP